MSNDLTPGRPAYEARAIDCTCTWLMGFGVGHISEQWCEIIMSRDEDCVVHRNWIDPILEGNRK